MTRVDLFYVEAGGGHKSAATALKSVIESQGLPWDVRLVNMDHALGEIDVFRNTTGIGTEDIYNTLLKRGWTALARYLMPGMHLFIWLLHGKQVRILTRLFRERQPAMVVSLIPHFNRALGEACRGLNLPFVTILTDFADIPPRVWIERQKQYIICGTDKAVEQAYAFGHAKDRVFRVSGMILRPAFYGVPPIDRPAERIAMGLEPDLPTGLLLFGGEGSKSMIEIAGRLAASGLRLQLIFLYGRNEELGQKLRALKLPFPTYLQGFTKEVPRYMQVADFLIGKPGPGSISEALAMRLPVICDRNFSTLPQEVYNADWLLENKLGMVVKSWKEIQAAVGKLLEPGRLEDYRKRASALDNQAVHEIPKILNQVLRQGP